MLVKHNFTSPVPEGTQSGPGKSLVGPNEWNDSHSVEFSSSDLPAITLTGTVTGSGTGGSITTSISASGVVAGSYTNASLTVGTDGRLTSASSGVAGFSSTGTGLTASGVTVSLIAPVTIADGGTGQTTSPTDGQLLVGDSSTGKFDLATLSPGNNVTITNGHGSILISASTGTSGFTSAGTGLTASGTTTVSLVVPVVIADGGTGQTASPTDGQLLIGDSSTGKFDLATLSPGNNITITNGHGSILISASASGTGTVTSVALSLPANLTVSGSPITTSGTFTASYILPPFAPQGRLTLQSGAAVMTTDSIAATTIFLDSYIGDQVPIYNGSGWIILTIAGDEISMGLSTAHITSGSLYDVFGVNNSGSLAIGAGPAWSTAASRGTGAGTTQIARQNGLWTNAVSLAHLWGGASGTTDLGAVSASQGIYLGTFYATANGQTAMQFTPAPASGGANPFMALSNGYNRVLQSSLNCDSKTSWTKSGTTWGAADASTSNRVNFVDGLALSSVNGDWTIIASQGSALPFVGMSLDSTTNVPQVSGGYGALSNVVGQITVPDSWPPQIGLHFVQAMEVANGSGSANFFGAQTSPTRQLNGLRVTLWT